MSDDPTSLMGVVAIVQHLAKRVAELEKAEQERSQREEQESWRAMGDDL